MHLLFFNNLFFAAIFISAKFPLFFNLFLFIIRTISSRFPTFHLITTPSVQYIQSNKPELILKRATWHANMKSNKALAPNLRGPREEAGIQVIMSFPPYVGYVTNLWRSDWAHILPAIHWSLLHYCHDDGDEGTRLPRF